MRVEGFHVELDVLTDAAAGINRTLALLSDRPVDAVSLRAGQLGHGPLTDRLDEFCSRWHLGVEHLAGDAAEAGSRLLRAVQNYLAAEHTVQGRLGPPVEGPAATDPGGA